MGIQTKGKAAIYSEEAVNRFNIKCMFYIIGLVLLLWILNLLNVFILDKQIYEKALLSSLAVMGTLFVALLVTGYRKRYVKYLILVCFVLVAAILYIYLSYHVTLGLLFPMIFAALYRRKKVLLFAYLFTIVATAAATILAYDTGLCDANMIFMTHSTAEHFIATLAEQVPVSGTPVLQLLLFYAFPRCVILTGAFPLLIHITVTMDRNTEELIESQKKNLELMRSQSEMQTEIIESLSSIIESRDQVTGNHIHNTGSYVQFIAEKLMQDGKFLGILTPEYADLSIKAAPLHDVGKIRISDTILCKPGKLTSEEFDRMKLHTVYGENIMKEIIGGLKNSHYLTTAVDMAVGHHERYDGTGYPKGLAGEEIPLCARIMAVADVLDALLSKRHYKDAYSLEKSKEIMEGELGKQFDPAVLSALLDHWEEFVMMYKGENH